MDVLDGGGKEILNKFADFFQDPSIKKVASLSFHSSFYGFSLITHLYVQNLLRVCLIIFW